MKKRSTWLLVSCLIVATLLVASCAPIATEEKETALPPAEEEVAPSEEEETAPSPIEEEVAPSEEEETLPPVEEDVVTEEEAVVWVTPASSSVPDQNLSVEVTDDDIFIGTELLGRPTDRTVTVNVAAAVDLEVYFEYGTKYGVYADRTVVAEYPGMKPFEVTINNLQPNTRYYYQMHYRQPGEPDFSTGSEHTFHTQRAPGSTFTFAIQSDSHLPMKSLCDPELYTRTLRNAASEYPDFYFTMGDDFDITGLRRNNPDTVIQRYIQQRPFLGLVGHSAPVFLVNGNHEEAAAYALDGTPDINAVWAQNARNLYYPQPAPDDFYTGDIEPVEFIGLLRDYYSWTWGDALFITIDPYWHSPVRVQGWSSVARPWDMWEITLGDTQYQWFKQTLEQSKAKYKFVFTHHVLGTGRGGIDIADLYEWGGNNEDGVWEFDKKRPGWELPIHQLMAKNGVTIFFQGHDHLFVRQELDGITYQTVPRPGDPAYKLPKGHTAYTSGVKLPGPGHLNVTVSTSQVKVDYIQSYLPEDETEGKENGQVAYSYTISAD